MNRRNIFKIAACAIAASAMDVMGWKGVEVPPKVAPLPSYLKGGLQCSSTEIDNFFILESERLLKSYRMHLTIRKHMM